MIKIINIKGHNEMCGGYSYSGDCVFDGKTVKDVLKEIKEYTNNHPSMSFKKINGYGNDDDGFGNAWKICIEDKVYLNGWLNNHYDQQYNGEYDNNEVESIKINGGWYCAYDFHIKVKKNICTF